MDCVMEGYDRYGYFVGTGKKTYQRTIRMSEYIREKLELYEGNGLNEKFERLVLESFSRLPQLEKEIENRKRELKDLDEKIKKYKNIISDLDEIKFLCNNFYSDVEEMLKK